jgi:hypothetical protein
MLVYQRLGDFTGNHLKGWKILGELDEKDEKTTKWHPIINR